MKDDDYLDVSLLMTDSLLFWCSVQSGFPDDLFSPMSFCLVFLFFHVVTLQACFVSNSRNVWLTSTDIRLSPSRGLRMIPEIP